MLSSLTIAFIVLKLCGVITWKWGMVLLPLGIEFVLFLVVEIIRYVEDIWR